MWLCYLQDDYKQLSPFSWPTRRVMEQIDQDPKPWSDAQTYTMVAICLTVGIVAGYLVHSPAVASSSVPQAAISQRAVPGNPSGQMPSAADLKRMAEKQVAPLLVDLQKHPKDADLLAKIGRAYLAARQFQSAKQYYEQSVALKANPDALNELSFVYCSLGDVDKGIETLHRALNLDPKDSRLLYNLGVYQWRGKSDPKAAIAAWQGYLKVDPNGPKRAEVERMIAQAKKHLNIPPDTKTDKPAM
jgi:cytochrome c-type biogenesis protein CcmH/NrfG